MNTPKNSAVLIRQQAVGDISLPSRPAKFRRNMFSVVICTVLAFCCSGPLAAGQIITNSFVSSSSTYVSSAAVDTNYGGSIVLEMASLGAVREGMVRWDLSTIPGDAVITGATVTLFGSYALNMPAGGNLMMYQTTSAWDENTVTWNTKPTAGTFLGSSSVSTNEQSKSYTYDSPELLSLVQSWHSGSADNFGIYLQFTNFTQGLVAVHSDDAVNSSLHPLLEVTYVPEPSTYALLAMSGLALAGYVIRRRRRV